MNKNYNKYAAYKFTISETEEILRNLLHDKGIYLKPRAYFYEAESYNIFLDADKIDTRLAQYLDVRACEHYRTDNGVVVIVTVE